MWELLGTIFLLILLLFVCIGIGILVETDETTDERKIKRCFKNIETLLKCLKDSNSTQYERAFDQSLLDQKESIETLLNDVNDKVDFVVEKKQLQKQKDKLDHIRMEIKNINDVETLETVIGKFREFKSEIMKFNYKNISHKKIQNKIISTAEEERRNLCLIMTAIENMDLLRNTIDEIEQQFNQEMEKNFTSDYLDKITDTMKTLEEFNTNKNKYLDSEKDYLKNKLVQFWTKVKLCNKRHVNTCQFISLL